MKPWLLLIGCCWIGAIQAQTPLEISCDKTTTLVFPFAIRHVDRGSRDILIQPVKEADHILLIKGAKDHFTETSLSVITGDGNVFVFTVNYTDKPVLLHYPAAPSLPVSMISVAQSLLNSERTLRGIYDHKWEVAARLWSLHVKGDTLYFQFRLTNESPFNYEVDFIKIFLRDRRQGKRTAMQQKELIPLYVCGNTKGVRAKSQGSMVVVLPQFTVPEKQYVAIELGEKNGGRHLNLRVNNRKLLQAVSLSPNP